MNRIVLATRNKHKIEEIQTILKDLRLEILTLNDFPDVPVLKEEGSTFQENSLQKAHAVHVHTKLPALADDSGLEVFFLNGRPGVISARYAGDGATDEENNAKLLGKMRGVAPRRRRAQFRAVLTLCSHNGREVTEGVGRVTAWYEWLRLRSDLHPGRIFTNVRRAHVGGEEQDQSPSKGVGEDEGDSEEGDGGRCLKNPF
jgi:non-canonical purine NTP pyrophosphatase (RdgB/HAM1 family)